MYTALVLDEKSRSKLVQSFAHLIPPSWEVVAHHMTINMGPARKGPAKDNLGEDAELTVVSIAADNLVMAVGVTSTVPSQNDIKHVTLAVNRDEGGKPFYSNKLKNWEPLEEPFDLTGTILEV